MDATIDNNKSIYPPDIPSRKFATIFAKAFHKYSSGIAIMIAEGEYPRDFNEKEIREAMFRETSDQRIYNARIEKE